MALSGVSAKADWRLINGITFFILIIIFVLIAVKISKEDTPLTINNNPDPNIPYISEQQKSLDEIQKRLNENMKQYQLKKEISIPKIDVIKKDPDFSIKEKKEEYRTTLYDSQFRPDPNSSIEISRVPPNTKLKVLEKQIVQQGMMKNNWYKVNYNGQTGWISGWNMKEQEEVVITSIEEMEKNMRKE